MGGLSFWHMLLLLGIVLLVFGPSRLPGVGKSLGEAIRGFKKGLEGTDDDEPNPRREQLHSSHDEDQDLKGSSYSEKNKTRS